FGARKFLDMEVSAPGRADAEAPSQDPANLVSVARRTLSQAYRQFEVSGRDRGTIAITVHARVQAIRGRSRAAVCSLAPITAGLQRDDEWRNRNPGGTSRGFRRCCPPHPHGASNAGHDAGRPRSPASRYKDGLRGLAYFLKTAAFGQAI